MDADGNILPCDLLPLLDYTPNIVIKPDHPAWSELLRLRRRTALRARIVTLHFHFAAYDHTDRVSALKECGRRVPFCVLRPHLSLLFVMEPWHKRRSQWISWFTIELARWVDPRVCCVQVHLRETRDNRKSNSDERYIRNQLRFLCRGQAGPRELRIHDWNMVKIPRIRSTSVRLYCDPEVSALPYLRADLKTLPDDFMGSVEYVDIDRTVGSWDVGNGEASEVDVARDLMVQAVQKKLGRWPQELRRRWHGQLRFGLSEDFPCDCMLSRRTS